MNKLLIYKIMVVTALMVLTTGCGKKVEDSTQTKIDIPTEMKDSVVIVTVGIDSLNALEVLKAEHEVDEVSSAMGTFVKGIDGVENNRRTFWFFEINGDMASKAADKILTTSSDTIKWYFRQPGTEKPTQENNDEE